MKKIFTLIILLAFNSSNAQWKTIDEIDEFGDKTGNKEEILWTVGKFSNSATTNSKAILKITLKKYNTPTWDTNLLGRLFFELYEYNSNPADLNRKYESLVVSYKLNKDSIIRAEILTNRYSNDNEFSLSYYIDAEKKNEEGTKKEYVGIDTYEISKPTYDKEKIIYDAIIYGSSKIKLNIYSGTSSYYFQFSGKGDIR